MLNVSTTRSKSNLLIVGGGPAGLSAAIAAATEGLTVTVVENDQFGGQARTSTKIENYPAVDEVTGEELTGRMVMQARRHGARLQLATITRLERDGDCLVATDDEEEEYRATTVLVASGVQYRRLRAENVDAYVGWGVQYGSPSIHTTYDNEEIYVVGGANSAGQAAFHLAECNGCTVHLVVRAAKLSKGMSVYLIKKIAPQVANFEAIEADVKKILTDEDYAEVLAIREHRQVHNVVVHLETEVTAVDGKGKLETLALLDKPTGETREAPADRMFIMIGAIPKTSWLNGSAQRDDHGFLLAGNDLPEEVRGKFIKVCERPPLGDETCQRGVFVIGDVRANAFRRVVTAVGGGQYVVASLLRYSEELGL